MSSRQKASACEQLAKAFYEREGYSTLDLKQGADFLAPKAGEPLRLVEAKYRGSQLTASQKMTREIANQKGLKYDVLRCACNSL